MTLIRRTSPFGELLSLRQAMDRLFEDSFVRPRAFAGSDVEQGLPLDIRITENELVLTAALPGVKPEDVDISVTGETLTITGKTQEEKRDEQDGYVYQEIRRGTFSRTVTLPGDLKVDQARAGFENGMLTLSIPKAEEAKPRQIRISASGEGTASSARQVGSSEASGRRVGPTADSGSAAGSTEAR
jgi:HSP20 family protein